MTLLGFEYAHVHMVQHVGVWLSWTTGMDSRLPALLRQFDRSGVRPDWVIILGGINDLGKVLRSQPLYGQRPALRPTAKQHYSAIFIKPIASCVNARCMQS